MTATITPEERVLLNVRLAIQPYQGEDNRVAKKKLCRRLRMSDRKLRAAVSELQSRGELIFSDCDEGGYFYLGSDPAPAQHYIAQEKHRASQILDKARALEHALKATRGVDASQGRMF